MPISDEGLAVTTSRATERAKVEGGDEAISMAEALAIMGDDGDGSSTQAGDVLALLGDEDAEAAKAAKAKRYDSKSDDILLEDHQRL